MLILRDYSVLAMAKKPRKVATHSFQPSDRDSQIIADLQEKLGVKTISDIIRMGLRVLAEKEGLKAA